MANVKDHALLLCDYIQALNTPEIPVVLAGFNAPQPNTTYIMVQPYQVDMYQHDIEWQEERVDEDDAQKTQLWGIVREWPR